MIDRVSKLAALLAGLATLVVTCLIAYDSLLRYFFNEPQLFVDELAGYLQVFIIFAGLAYTFLSGGHVRVDLLTSHLRPRRRARLRVLTLTLGLVLVLAVAWVTGQSALTAWSYERVSTVMLYPLWLPMALIPLGLALLALALAKSLLRQLRALRGPESGRDEINLSAQGPLT